MGQGINNIVPKKIQRQHIFVLVNDISTNTKWKYLILYYSY